jgi:hypothetical protein
MIGISPAEEEVHIIISTESELLRFFRLRALKPFVPEAALNEVLRLTSFEADVVRIRSADDGLVSRSPQSTHAKTQRA